MKDIIQIVMSLEDSDFWIKGVTQTIENGTKEQKGWFLGMSIVSLVSSLLQEMLAGKGVNAGDRVIWAS